MKYLYIHAMDPPPPTTTNVASQIRVMLRKCLPERECEVQRKQLIKDEKKEKKRKEKALVGLGV